MELLDRAVRDHSAPQACCVIRRSLSRRPGVLDRLGLSHEQIEELMATIARSFGVCFPDHALDEIVKLEELCLVASWLKGYYKRPDFISPHFERKCRAASLIASGLSKTPTMPNIWLTSSSFLR